MMSSMGCVSCSAARRCSLAKPESAPRCWPRASDRATLVAMTVAELPDGPETVRCLELRRLLGLPHGPAAPALIAGDGAPLSTETLDTWLRRARLVSLSLESNGGICRSLLRVRHGVRDPTEEMAR